ncbi:MAG: ORF6N domain-containing protein [Bacteroidota bacterium]
MLDRDLTDLYGVTTGNLNKAVKRNRKRFPKDFMFRVNSKEFKNLIFQNGISKQGGTRSLP